MPRKSEMTFSFPNNLSYCKLTSVDHWQRALIRKQAGIDVEVNYLQAILGARSDDKSMMLEYLGKAFKQAPELKDKAMYDREFIKFYADPDFKALVGMN